ncbi:nuclear transport factor 2 family protein [Arthrobacter sp. ISL-65]|uniref:nuclear transport factor 2 family protein n=1 Tax=Arthrobacter sp. ISL-65 TaxID=2819112 RepID=UPI00203531F1|nr:nuclear transport factor 2 family protein [Arthrobacter sp. ISL-65]
MGTQEDADLVRRGYEAFGAGDMDTLRSLFEEDAVWHLGGSGGLSGDKQGRDAVLAYFGELFTRSDGTIRVDLDNLIGGEKSHRWLPDVLTAFSVAVRSARVFCRRQHRVMPWQMR